MTVELIKYPSEEDWMLCKKCTLVTVGKTPITPPTAEWKKSILRARHSPIRELNYYFLISDVPYWVAMHLVRHHVGCQPYVKTQRTDRTGEARDVLPQDAPVDMIWRLNAESLMTVANKRLCRMAAKETREVVQRMCDEVLKVCHEFDWLLVPACVYHGGICYEINGCKGK